jgi:hypothetical protein
MTRSLEVKGQRPETVNGAGTAPQVIKRRGRTPRRADQCKSGRISRPLANERLHTNAHRNPNTAHA